MHLLRFSGDKGFFEMQFEEGEALPQHAPADLRVLISASSEGFSANSHCWVDRTSFVGFLRALVSLGESRAGEALLASMSPGELSFRVFSSSALGHMAIEGSISHQFPGERLQHQHTLSVGFEIDPSEVANSAKTPWVRTFAS
jgi:hypothetical protein